MFPKMSDEVSHDGGPIVMFGPQGELSHVESDCASESKIVGIVQCSDCQIHPQRHRKGRIIWVNLLEGERALIDKADLPCSEVGMRSRSQTKISLTFRTVFRGYKLDELLYIKCSRHDTSEGRRIDPRHVELDRFGGFHTI